ncbi:MAG: methyltransferase domain-containing protein [Chloroflexi bacterium]|nr:methyltransferase domain-containing protein [Chloroflexota bacterium]
MDSADFAFLTSPDGIAALADLADEDVSESAALALITRLRKSYSREQAAALVDQMRLRRAAIDKFGSTADRMLFTRDALEQASDPAVRSYRAASVAETGAHSIIDACCGIGSDSLAFAQAGLDVLGVDLDPVRIELARHNAAVLGLPNARFAVHDVTRGLPEPADLVFFDPARRADGKRIYHVEGISRRCRPCATGTRARCGPSSRPAST